MYLRTPVLSKSKVSSNSIYSGPEIIKDLSSTSFKLTVELSTCQTHTDVPREEKTMDVNKKCIEKHIADLLKISKYCVRERERERERERDML